jgi:hypothetical protein
VKANPEYDKFTDAMELLIKVPHSKLKKMLDANKAAKKRKKSKKFSAYRAGRVAHHYYSDRRTNEFK